MNKLTKFIISPYCTGVRYFVEFLIRKNYLMTAMILGTLLMEPLQAIRAAFWNFANLKKPFNFHKMNPTIISEEHSKKIPILLLHGNLHNQSAWLRLGKALKKQGLGPVFTVNLPHGNITNKDFEIIQRKIDEIKKAYNSNVKIDVIGHSRGGDIAPFIPSAHIRKIIKIGSVQDQGDSDHIYEILGEYDVLETRASLCAANRQKRVHTGHLGLLYSKETHKNIIQFLSK